MCATTWTGKSGSIGFLGRVRSLLEEKPTDRSVPQLEHLRGRPTVEAIKEAVGAHFGVDTSRWAPGRREDNASRAVAAYLARRCFGHPAAKVADRHIKVAGHHVGRPKYSATVNEDDTVALEFDR